MNAAKALAPLGVIALAILISPIASAAITPPNEISGLEAWYQADNIVNGAEPTGGTSIHSWYDSSGNGHNLSSAGGTSGPTFLSDGGTGFGNRPVVGFDGSNDELFTSSALTGQTIIVLADFSDVQFQEALFSARDDYLLDLYGEGTNVWSTGMSGTTTVYQDSAIPLTTTTGFPDTFTMDVSSGPHVVALAFAGSATEAFQLGQAATSSFGYAQGSIAEVIIYNRQLSDEEIHQIGAYLLDKYHWPNSAFIQIESLSPAAGAANVAVGANLVATFSKPIAAGTGTIVLKKASDASTVEIFDVRTSPQLTFDGADLIINPTSDLEPVSSTDPGVAYYIQIDSGAIQEKTSEQPFLGIQDTTTWNFITAGAPIIDSLLPADNANAVDVDTNLVVTFSKPVVAGSGTITLCRASNNLVVETFDVNSSPRLNLNDTELTIDPTADLEANVTYYLLIASGAVEDASGNSFAGISQPSTWNFTTLDSNSVMGGDLVYDFNGYRIHVFTSSGELDVNTAVDVDLLVVGGGGGGDGGVGGGGGAGGLIFEQNYSLSAQSYVVTIGGGGAPGAAGSDSSFGTDPSIVAIGGGRGQYTGDNSPAGSGGSGGGGTLRLTAGGLGTAGQGNDGGKARPSGQSGGGGGGGATTAGLDAPADRQGGNGGQGWDGSSYFGTSVGASGWFAGGGGGGTRTVGGSGTIVAGLGHSGGGDANLNAPGDDAQDGTGSGGGGGTYDGANRPGGSGGSGIVIVRYAITSNYKVVNYEDNGSDGGSVPVDAGSPYPSGATVTVQDNTGGLTKAGATFAGWNTQSDGSGTAYTAGNSFSISEDLILYAQWTPTQTSTYADYAGDNGGSTTDPSADENNNGVRDGLEYAFYEALGAGAKLDSVEKLNQVVSFSLEDTEGTPDNGGDDRIKYAVLMPTAPPADVTYRVYASSDAPFDSAKTLLATYSGGGSGSWTAANGATVEEAGPGSEDVIVDTESPSSSPRRFVWLEVEIDGL